MTLGHFGTVRGFACVLAMALLWLPAALRAQSILYVDDDAPVGGDGLSWTGAHRFLSDALAEAATPGSDVIEVRIAGGLYRPDRSEAAPNGTGDRLATFLLPDGIPVVGGYAGLNGDDPDERDIEQYETILSGDLAGDDEPGFINNDENCYHVAITPGEDTLSILDGLTITAGHADGDKDLYLDDGAGLFNMLGSLIVSHCTFRSNDAEDGGGGGVKCRMKDGVVVELRFTNCAFVGNSARGGAAALIDCDYQSHCEVTIESCLLASNTTEFSGGGLAVVCNHKGTLVNLTIHSTDFVNNTAGIYADNAEGRDGGGLRALRSGLAALLVTISNCAFSDNTATGCGGGAHIWGSDRVRVTDCSFTNNQASGGSYFGDPYFGVGGGLNMTLAVDACIASCTFINNKAGDEVFPGIGGGVRCNLSDAHITNCRFEDNVASTWGGGLNTQSSDPAIADCRFVANIADQGGGIAAFKSNGSMSRCTFYANSAYDLGGAIYFRTKSEPQLDNCVMIGNDAGTGGALAVRKGSVPSITNCTMLCNSADAGGAAWIAREWNEPGIDDSRFPSIINCIAYDNGESPIDDAVGTTVQHSNVQGGYEGEGNIDADPHFVQMPHPGKDGEWGTDDDEPGDLRLQGGSPCIDAGVSRALHLKMATDWGGQPRFVDDPGTRDTGVWDALRPPIDMGALEFQGVTVTSRGDIDGDGDVDAADLAILLGAWGPCPSPPNECHADLDGDGEVGPIDLAVMLGDWTT